MTQQVLSNLRDTAELFALKSTLAYHGLDADDLLTRFFSKLKARNIDSVFEIETFLSVANRMVTANIKTTNGTVGLQVYTPQLHVVHSKLSWSTLRHKQLNCFSSCKVIKQRSRGCSTVRLTKQ